MEGTERAQPVHSIYRNRIVYQSCRVLWTWKGLSESSLFTLLVLTGSCRVIWTLKGLSEPSLFTLLDLTGLFTSLVE